MTVLVVVNGLNTHVIESTEAIEVCNFALNFLPIIWRYLVNQRFDFFLQSKLEELRR